MTGQPSAPSLTERLAGFASGLRFEDVPDDLVERIGLHLLDAIGCALASRGTDYAARILAVTRLQAADGPCPLAGTAATTTPAAAAFATAALINALDFDDGLEVAGKGLGHPGASIVAAALAAVGGTPIDGRRFLTALAAGFEVNARVILSIQPSPERHRLVYGVCQHQSIGAAVAHARLAGLDRAATAGAIGFAGSLTPLPSLRKYNWQQRPLVSFKDYVAPAAEAGVRAAQFAAAGLIGPADVLDGESGFWRMIGSDRFDPNVLVDDLGATWWAENLSLKPYPACRWMHTALESFQSAVAAVPVAPQAIDRIVVSTSAGLARDFLDPRPATMVDAQFSLPHCLAAIALGIPEQRWFAPEVMADPDLLAVAARVDAEVDPEIDRIMSGPERRPAGRVRFRTGGRWVEGPFLAQPLGTPERRLTAEAVIAKFERNAAVAFDAPRIARIRRTILSLTQPGAVIDPTAWVEAMTSRGNAHDD